MSSSIHSFVPAPLRRYSRAASLRLRELQYCAMNAVTRINPRPIFVLGNQKSGTTAIAALFARLSGQTVTLDLFREVWWPTYQGIPSGDMSFDAFVARNRWGFSRDVVKEPNLTLFPDALADKFPEARYIFVVRDPRDNIRSLLNRLQISGDLPALDPEPLRGADPPVPPGWEVVLHAGAAFGIPGDHYIDRLAHRWRLCFENYQARANGMHLCRYEDFQQDKVGTLTALAEKLGCRTDGDVSERLDRAFVPGGDNSKSWTEFFGAESLARIERICAEGIRTLGYPAGSA